MRWAVAATAWMPPNGDFVRASQMHRGDDGRMRLATKRRRCNNALHPGCLGRDNAHVRRGDHRVSTPRDIAADAINWNILVPEHNARKCLHFHVAQRRTLRQCKIADLLLCKLNIGDDLPRQ